MPRVNGYDIEERWFVLDHPRGPLHTFKSQQDAIVEIANLKKSYSVDKIPNFIAAEGWFVVCATIVKEGAFTLKISAERKAEDMKKCNGDAPKLKPDNPFQAEEKTKLEKEKNSTRTPPAVSKPY